MKNIFVLLSDKPSRLFTPTLWEEQLRFFLEKDKTVSKNKEYQPKNIYITSDEEIKEGDWCVCSDYKNSYYKIGKCSHIGSPFNFKNTIQINGDADLHNDREILDYCKKIVLCTDSELIKNGVQSIDDDFLEWFVKNPSCEFVEVDKEECQMWSLIGCNKDDVGCCKKPIKGYKPIIPQPKQETIEEVVKDLNYWKNNAEEDYLQVPISVLRYISELEKHQSEKMFIKVKNSELLLPVTDKNYVNVIDLYGKKYNIEPVGGTNPKLKLLDKNQSVVYGDGETYHFLLTEK